MYCLQLQLLFFEIFLISTSQDTNVAITRNIITKPVKYDIECRPTVCKYYFFILQNPGFDKI